MKYSTSLTQELRHPAPKQKPVKSPQTADHCPSLGEHVRYHCPVRTRPSPANPVQYPQIAPPHPTRPSSPHSKCSQATAQPWTGKCSITSQYSQYSTSLSQQRLPTTTTHTHLSHPKPLKCPQPLPQDADSSQDDIAALPMTNSQQTWGTKTTQHNTQSPAIHGAVARLATVPCNHPPLPILMPYFDPGTAPPSPQPDACEIPPDSRPNSPHSKCSQAPAQPWTGKCSITSQYTPAKARPQRSICSTPN